MQVCVCACVCVCVCVCVYAHLVPALYEDPTSLRADNCTYIHTYIHTYISFSITNSKCVSSFVGRYDMYGNLEGTRDEAVVAYLNTIPDFVLKD